MRSIFGPLSRPLAQTLAVVARAPGGFKFQRLGRGKTTQHFGFVLYLQVSVDQLTNPATRGIAVPYAAIGGGEVLTSLDFRG